MLVFGMLCWKLEGVAGAKFGSFDGLSEVHFLVARSLKRHPGRKCTYLLSCPSPQSLSALALAVRIIRPKQTIENTIARPRSICAWMGEMHTPPPSAAEKPSTRAGE